MITEIPSYQAIKDFFYINFDLIYERNDDLDHLFVQITKNYKQRLEKVYVNEPIFHTWKEYKFPVFIYQNAENNAIQNNEISFDILLNSFIFLSGYLELINESKDKHGRFPYSASLQKKYNFAAIPVVSIYMEMLYEMALKRGLKISKKTKSKNIIFTHDIDQLRSGWFENIQFYKEYFSLKSLYEIPKNILVKVLGLKDDYLKGMEEMLSIDSKNNIEAISFFIPKKSAKDADFELTDPKFNSLITESKKTQEIGFHPGYETFDNQEKFKEQKEDLEFIFKTKITKSRQHFLRYDMIHTPYIIEQSKICEDYTLGFAEQYGFRNGIAHPFYLFNFKENRAFNFLSVPLVFMDVSLTNYTNINENKRALLFNEIEAFLIETKTKFPTQASVLFHNSVFSNAKYKGFKSFYKKLIKI